MVGVVCAYSISGYFIPTVASFFVLSFLPSPGHWVYLPTLGSPSTGLLRHGSREGMGMRQKEDEMK